MQKRNDVDDRDINRGWFPRFWFLRAIVAALPMALIAFAYARAFSTGHATLGIQIDWLQEMIGLEALAIHAFPFISIVALTRPSRPEHQGLKWLWISLVMLVCFSIAYDYAKWSGVFYLFSLVGLTYLGSLVNWTRGGSIVGIGIRWLTTFVLLMVLCGVLNMPVDSADWGRDTRSLSFGAIYFGMLALFELTGFYQLKVIANLDRELKEGIAKLPWGSGTADSLAARIWRAVFPIAGSAVWCFPPLFLVTVLSVAFARFVYAADDGLSTLSLIHEGVVAVALCTFLAWRTVHVIWVGKGLSTSSNWRWWKSPKVLISLAIICLGYILSTSGFASYGQPASLRYERLLTDKLVQYYLTFEFFLLLFMVPLTWLAIVRRQNKTGESKASLQQKPLVSVNSY